MTAGKVMSTTRVARINNQARPACQFRIIDIVMVRAYDDCVEIRDGSLRQRERPSSCIFRMLPAERNFGNKWVMVRHFCPALLELFDDLEGWALARIFHILLVGNSQDQDLSPPRAPCRRAR